MNNKEKSGRQGLLEKLPLIIGLAGIALVIVSLFVGTAAFFCALVLAVVGLVSSIILFIRFKNTEDYRYSPPPALPGTIVSVVALIAVAFVAINSIVIVDAGEQGVVTASPAGNDGDTLGEGWHFDTTYVLSNIDTIRYNTQTDEFIGGDGDEDYDGCITVMSKDGSTINIDISVTYHIPAGKVKELRFEYGHDWRDTIINQAVRSEPRTICALYEATQFISADRAAIESALVTALTEKIDSYGMVVVDSVQIKEFRIPSSVTDAVQAKLIALQQKEKAETEAETLQIQATAQANADKIAAEAAAQIALIEAQGKAKAVEEVRAQFDTEADYLRYLYIQALNDPDSNVKYVVPEDSIIVADA